MSKTKVLILHTSVGFGIKVTAEAIFEKLEKSGEYDVRIEDVEKVESGAVTSLIRIAYLVVLDNLSSLWGFLYDSNLVMFFALPVRKFFASFKSKDVLRILREFQPAVVISTQTVPTGIVAYLKSKGLYRGKLVAVFSDYHLHRFWLYDEVDLYICNIAEQVSELRRLGVSEERIALTGTLVFDKFFEPISREDACLEFKLLTSMPTVILGGAGRARAANKEIYLQLLRSPKSFQIVVICGNNEKLKEELLQISTPSRHPAKILGYIKNMQVLMSAGSVLVYKTGGPSMAEAVIKKLPMILTDVRPGHELVNLNYLVKWGIVKHGRNPREVLFLVEQLFDSKVPIQAEKSFAKIVKPPGSITVVEAVGIVAPKPEMPKIRNFQESSR
jgi:processive 1,2-diacylglycerol beta-glucosyltransferase